MILGKKGWQRGEEVARFVEGSIEREGARLRWAAGGGCVALRAAEHDFAAGRLYAEDLAAVIVPFLRDQRPAANSNLHRLPPRHGGGALASHPENATARSRPESQSLHRLRPR